MKRFLTPIVFAILLGGFIFAQEKKEPIKAPTPAPATKAWKLTPSQQKVLISFIDEYNKRIQDMISDFIKEIQAFKIYPDMPADVKFNLQTLTFEGIPIQEKKESKEIKK